MLTEEEIRALALRGQGFGESYRRPVDVLKRLGVIQLDSVDVLARSHELTVFSRYGAYDPLHLNQQVYDDRTGFEYWGHSMSWIDLADYPLFLHRVEHLRESGRGASTVNKEVRDEHAELYAHVLDMVDAKGPVSAADFSGAGSGGWWKLKPAKQVLEDLFDQGVLMCAGRTQGFARQYDRAERVLPPRTDTRNPGQERAAYELIVRAVARMGIGTAREVADYYRLHKWPAPWREALARAVADGRVTELKIPGWRGHAYADPACLDGPKTLPDHPPTFLSPLDNLLWDRKRIQRVFSFEHTFEIYVPAERRRYGYYVLPLLARGALGGRADLKLDRQHGVLQVRGLWLEGASPQEAAAALRTLAQHVRADDIALDEGEHRAQIVRALS
ncbi:winged helix-turn-helix domain-containing protein [Actinomadura sp. ATCC 39365]